MLYLPFKTKEPSLNIGPYGGRTRDLGVIT